jgi:hypothetical protein
MKIWITTKFSLEGTTKDVKCYIAPKKKKKKKILYEMSKMSYFSFVRNDEEI